MYLYEGKLWLIRGNTVTSKAKMYTHLETIKRTHTDIRQSLVVCNREIKEKKEKWFCVQTLD